MIKLKNDVIELIKLRINNSSIWEERIYIDKYYASCGALAKFDLDGFIINKYDIMYYIKNHTNGEIFINLYKKTRYNKLKKATFDLFNLKNIYIQFDSSTQEFIITYNEPKNDDIHYYYIEKNNIDEEPKPIILDWWE